MADSLAFPAAMDVLRTHLQANAPAEDLFPLLRTIQRIGVSQTDLIVHVERLRAENDVTAQDPAVEEAALLALDLIGGYAGGSLSLRWDPPEMASIAVPRAISTELLEAAAQWAVQASDLLPPRPTDESSLSAVRQLLRLVDAELREDRYRPVPADFVRVPKSSFTSRPAALLGLQDRFAYEALASAVAEELGSSLPAEVIWPRTRNVPPDISDVFEEPLRWQSKYIVKADVASFFEGVDHGILAVFLARYLHVDSRVVVAVESLLDAIHGTSFGLPQGSPGSDVFGSAYLLPVDLTLKERGWQFIRYMDDYYVAAASLGDARAKIELLERHLRGLGLRLNVEKTRPMRRDTYESGLRNPSRRVRRLRERLRRAAEASVLQSDDPDFVTQQLLEWGVEEQTLWDLMYHQTTTLAEVLQENRHLLTPELVDVYRTMLVQLARSLEGEKLPPDMDDVESDAVRALSFLAAGKVPVGNARLQTFLQWFPRTAPDIAAYLTSMADSTPDDVAEFVSTEIRSSQHGDWVTAWLCAVPEAAPQLVSRGLERVLDEVLGSPTFGDLARVTASRALANAGAVDPARLLDFLEVTSAPIKSEIVFTAIAQPDLYKELRAALPPATSTEDE